MKVERGRPVIEREDHLRVVFDALIGSIAFYNANMEPDVASWWCKTAQDSYETLQSALGVSHDGIDTDWPERGDATLYMSLDQLELALVSHGCVQIDNGDSQDVAMVDTLLHKIDDAKVLDEKRS